MRRRRIKNFAKFKKGLTSLVKSQPRFLGILLIFFGAVSFLSPLTYKKYISKKSEEIRKDKEEVLFPCSSLGEVIETGPVKINKSCLVKSLSLANIPKRIIIPSLEIDLKIKPAKIVNGAWELSEDSASFGLGSATPGLGNTVIFAHAKFGLFRPLRAIKKGAKIYILTTQEYYVYEVEKIKTVLPSQVEVIEPTKDDTLTLFTCTGFADAKRLIVVAKRASD